MASNALHAGLADQKNQVKTLLEWQRHSYANHVAEEGSLAQTRVLNGRPTVDVEAALCTSFEVLLPKDSSDRASAGSPTTESDAFQIVAMAVQLEEYQLSEKDQRNIAEVVYRLWASTSPGVACRSLLETMLALDPCDSELFVEHLLRILQQTFTVGNKRSLQILYHLFDALAEEKLEQSFPDLTDKLAQCISSQSGGQQAARILGRLALQKSRGDPQHLLEILKPFVGQETYRAKQAVHETLLPPILSQVPQLQERLLDWLRIEAQASADHLFALLSLARLEDDSAKPVDRFDDLIATSIIHEDPLIRFEALRLLSSLPAGKASSRRFNVDHLKLHMMFWKYNLTDSDSPAVRTGLIGEWKHFIIRARLSSNAAARIVTKSKNLPESSKVIPEAEEAQAYLDAIETFFDDWVKHAAAQLLPVKPYRCHISSLIFLQILLEAGLDPQYHTGAPSKKHGKTSENLSWPMRVSIITPQLMQELITCIRSTYDDVRSIAAAMLASMPLEKSMLQLISDLGFLLVQQKREADIASATLCLRLASTISSRYPQCHDLYGSIDVTIPTLLDMLDARLQAFRESFSEASDQAPVHGILQAIAHLLQTCFASTTAPTPQLEAISRRCVKGIHDIWEVTKPILCRADLDVSEDADDAGAEDSVVLNASWRSIKEASNLLSVVLSLPLNTGVPLWSADELAQHASLFATWLLEIGHRGVFAHVSNAYSRLCANCVRVKGPEAHRPATWLKSHLADILDVERPSARRSAGLPYLLLGAITCFPPQSSEVKNAFQRLIRTAGDATQASDTIRTHAIHCLRVLLLDGKVAVASKPFIRAGFSLAITGFGNKHWGIRNASLLLYASLIQRLFSNRKENHLPLVRRTSIVDFFSQYEGLVPDLVEALSSGLRNSEPEALGSVFSVLLLLSLLVTPLNSTKASEHASAFYPLVDACAASAVWKVRETAAAAMTGLIPEVNVYDHCITVLRSCENVAGSNELHGKLMQVQALLVIRMESDQTAASDSMSRHWTEILAYLDRVVDGDMPLPILTQTLEILALSPTSLPEAISAKLHTWACRHYGQRRPGYETYSRALTKVLLKTEPFRYLERCLASPYAGSQAETLAYLRTQHVDDQHHLSLQESLFQIARSPEITLDNRRAAIELLAARGDTLLDDERQHDLIRQYKANDIPAIRQALLPLLARSTRVSNKHANVVLIREEICGLGDDESAASRNAACKSMANLGSWLKEEPFQYGHQLLKFLQDDDIDIRLAAGRLVSLQMAEGQSLCTSRAIELTWQMCLDVGSAEDARWLADGLVLHLVQALDDAERGSHLLFAVERANMHIDIMVDLSYSTQLLARRLERGTIAGQSVLARTERLEERLHELNRNIIEKTTLAESHQIRNTYAFNRASLLVQTLRKAEQGV